MLLRVIVFSLLLMLLAQPPDAVARDCKDLSSFSDKIDCYNEAIDYARSHFNGKHHDLAVRAYAEQLRNRGFAYARNDQLDRAISDVRQALKDNPADKRSYNALGYIYSKMGRYDQAVAAHEQAMQLGGASLVKWYQEEMRDSGGHYKGPIDGKFGRATRDALVTCVRDPVCAEDDD